MVRDLVLYVLMRTDMDSMSPGKAMAQACHAGGQFQKRYGKTEVYKEWSEQADGFGTTIVLDVHSESSLHERVARAISAHVPCGVVTDTSYPIDDGMVTHHVPLVTCGFIFLDRGTHDKDIVSDLELLTKSYDKGRTLGTCSVCGLPRELCVCAEIVRERKKYEKVMTW